MKKYDKPEIQITHLESENIMLVSSLIQESIKDSIAIDELFSDKL